MTARTLRLAALLTAVTLLTSGCGLLTDGLRGVTLPGGADLGEAPMEVTAEFSDVVDLVPQSLVMVDDVPVGTVTGITVSDDWTAMVTMLVNERVQLPSDATARVRTTSLLGEKFVELGSPDDGAGSGSLANGAVIPLERSGRAAEVEEVLGALSMLLNGGGVAQIRTIANELNLALDGNEPEIRALLDDVDALVGALDERKGEITRALDEVDRLSTTLADRRGQIEIALDDLAPGLQELEDQRSQLVDMLQALDRLSVVGTDVINRSRDDVLADLELLRPVLQKLAESGADLPESLQLLFTPPFTDAGEAAFAGDYANLYVTADLDLGSVLENLVRSNQPLLGPDSPLAALPPTGQLLGPLLGPTGALQGLQEFPLLGDVLPVLPGQVQPLPERAPEGSTRAPEPGQPTQLEQQEAEQDGGGLLGGLLGGGR
ncbi:MCE family protein [Pseudonocardia broussonetiae]|uniref:MCE family protein n=1 Tax=Pseudonocardia broussonetiae TaxID=2736640 RepID=A0A6M6JER9_9PSEU|nr:MCE family protein [Pseudonocardia broussonetiae]QJY46448.1 MCE family protein [Pseudonocardia broussonetiae]